MLAKVCTMLTLATDMTSIVHPPFLPPGYPRECEGTAVLRDGRPVFIRPLVPGDAHQLGFELQHADPETLYHRFFRSIRVNDALLEYLTVLDYERRFALAAFGEDGTGAGIARYERLDDSGTAEIAVAVSPGWRRVGLGTLLLRRLETAGRARGIDAFGADFLAENKAARGLIERGGFAEPVFTSGVGSVVHPLR